MYQAESAVSETAPASSSPTHITPAIPAAMQRTIASSRAITEEWYVS